MFIASIISGIPNLGIPLLRGREFWDFTLEMKAKLVHIFCFHTLLKFALVILVLLTLLVEILYLPNI